MSDLLDKTAKAIGWCGKKNCSCCGVYRERARKVLELVVEECAKVGDTEAPGWHEITGNPCVRIATAIRSLKGHP